MDERKVEHNSNNEVCQDDINWNDSTDVYLPPIKPLKDVLPEVERSEIDANSPTWIFFDTAAHDRMLTDASRDTSREHGGILIGEAYQDPEGQYYILLRGAIAAKDSEGTSTHLQFKPESWVPVWEHLQQNPNIRILGWYHTHPGLGVFLSGTDLKTQRLYFGSPWNIAIVIDPISRKIGYFWGRDGKRAKFIRKFCGATSKPVESNLIR